MQTIQKLNREDAPQKSQDLLKNVEKQMGSVPNIFLTFAHSPAALEGYLQFSGALAKGKLSRELREQIAVTAAGQNGCDYCASAHTYLGEIAGVKKEELACNLNGDSNDTKTRTALRFVKALIESRGNVSNNAISGLLEAGFNTEEIVEIIGHVGLNIFTNYFNHVAGTEIDFPLVTTKKPSCSSV